MLVMCCAVLRIRAGEESTALQVSDIRVRLHTISLYAQGLSLASAV